MRRRYYRLQKNVYQSRETNGYGVCIYDRLKNAGLSIDIVPLRYMNLRL